MNNQDDFKWTDEKVMDFVNWYLAIQNISFRHTLENKTIIDSFKSGDGISKWKNDCSVAWEFPKGLTYIDVDELQKSLTEEQKQKALEINEMFRTCTNDEANERIQRKLAECRENYEKLIKLNKIPQRNNKILIGILILMWAIYLTFLAYKY